MIATEDGVVGLNNRSIILVRHGQTGGNAEDKAQGHYDAPLTEKGVRQANILARRLAKTDFSAVYSSDLQRAVNTAEPLLKLRPNLKFALRSELRETYYGDYENTPWSTIRDQDPDFFWKWIDWETRPDATFPGGESERDMWQRIATFADEIVATHSAPNDSILVVAHGGPIQTLLAQFLKLRIRDQWRFNIDNTGITVLKEHTHLRNVWRAQSLNDTTHLQKPQI